MNPLSKADVAEIALLARLDLDDAEIDRLREDLVSILSHMDQLAEVDTEGVVPLYHTHASDLRLRPDETAESLPAELATAQAPDRAEGCFRVPHIIKTASDS
jgi:aspartyl-tRNA(Asn)/glutamyl-tRNA(Gln) amidotransferase subunit C